MLSETVPAPVCRLARLGLPDEKIFEAVARELKLDAEAASLIYFEAKMEAEITQERDYLAFAEEKPDVDEGGWPL